MKGYEYLRTFFLRTNVILYHSLNTELHERPSRDKKRTATDQTEPRRWADMNVTNIRDSDSEVMRKIRLEKTKQKRKRYH